MKKDNSLKHLVKGLRRKASDAELVLWYKLRNRQLEGAKFRHSQQIDKYIVDFVCFESKLVIEVDGGQHNEPQNLSKDEERTQALKKKHYQVLRYWDNDVLQNTDGVPEDIRNTLIRRTHPHLASPVKGEEQKRKSD